MNKSKKILLQNIDRNFIPNNRIKTVQLIDKKKSQDKFILPCFKKILGQKKSKLFYTLKGEKE